MTPVFQFPAGWRALLMMAATLPVLMACATSDFGPGQVLRSPEDGPDRFMVGDPNGDEMRETAAGEGCRSPMIDPRDGTRLRLVRSSSDRGDYAVPEGKYGVSERELIRLDCANGEIIGIVAR